MRLGSQHVRDDRVRIPDEREAHAVDLRAAENEGVERCGLDECTRLKPLDLVGTHADVVLRPEAQAGERLCVEVAEWLIEDVPGERWKRVAEVGPVRKSCFGI